MIHDKLTEFADASTDVVASTGRSLVGNVIDLGAAHRDIGNGRVVYLIILVDTEIDSAGDAATVDFELSSNASSTFALDGSDTVHVSTGAVAEAALTAGRTPFVLALPLEGNVYERYLGLVVNIGTEAVTAGAITAFLSLDQHGWQAYPDALPAFPA